MCQWNCAQLANALLAAELVGKEEAEGVMREYAEVRRGPCLHVRHTCTNACLFAAVQWVCVRMDVRAPS